MANTRGKNTVSGKKTVRHLNSRPAAAGHRTVHSDTAKRTKRAQKTNVRSAMDYSLILILLFLLAFGLLMLYSTSSYEASIQHGGDSAFFLKKQAIATVAGLFGMMFIARYLSMRFVRKLAWPAYWASLALVASLMAVGTEANGATRWIYIGGVSIQPAEICKLAIILVTADLICRMKSSELNSVVHGFPRIIIWALIQVVAIWKISDNMSSAMIVGLITLGMYFVATKGYKLYLGLTAIAAGGFALWTKIAITADSTKSFRTKRIKVWLDPASYSDDIGYQTIQALYGIGSGGIFGKGLGQSMQKLGFIPEAQNDMIFSIICEELGVFGAIAIIIAYILLCWRIMIIVTNAKDLYSSMVAAGVMIHIAVQAVLNIAVVTNTIPNTGVSLPFISYGGSSVVMLLAEIGLVLNIQRRIGQQA